MWTSAILLCACTLAVLQPYANGDDEVKFSEPTKHTPDAPNWADNLKKAYKPNPKAKVSSQIVGGTATTRGAYPWNAYMVNDGYAGLGSLISPQWVLTSGWIALPRTNFVVTLGMQKSNVYFEDGRVVLETTSKFVHPNYTSTSTNTDVNIALVKLPIAVPTTAYIKPVLLPKLSQAATTFAGTAAFATGWGREVATVSAISPELRVVSMPVMANTACASFWGMTANRLCVDTTGGKSPCHGDYGGALAYQESAGVWVQLGVFAYPENNCTAGVPSMYVRVSTKLSWISSTTGLVMRA